MKKPSINIIIFVLIILFGGYYIYKEYPQIVFFKKNSEEASTKTGYEKEPEVVTEKNTTLTIEEELEAAIEKAIIAKRGDYGGLNISVSEVVDDTYAKGGASPAGGGPGGGMWFAKKVDGEWELVWDGNGAIYCKDLEGYEDFPGRLIPECYDETTMQVVPR